MLNEIPRWVDRFFLIWALASAIFWKYKYDKLTKEN